MIDELVRVADDLATDPDRIHFERFGVAPIKQAQPISVALTKSNKTVEVAADQSILDAVLDAGVDVPHSCMSGLCKSCVVTAKSANIVHNDMCLSDDEKAKNQMCICVSRTLDENLIIEL